MAAAIGSEIMAIGTAIAAVLIAIAAEFNTPAFACSVGTTLQMHNRVTNSSDVDIFFKWGSAAIALPICMITAQIVATSIAALIVLPLEL